MPQQPPDNSNSNLRQTGGQKLLPRLIVGIKRRLRRADESKAKQAEADFRAVRKPALEKANYRCRFCTFRSQATSDVYHIDNNHHNNDIENLDGICKLCHPYLHVGEPSKLTQPSGLEEGHLGGTSATAMIRVPNSDAISAQDMNHLQRVIAIALTDEKEAAMARKIFDLLADKSNLTDMKLAFKSHRTNDMASALSNLTDDEYGDKESLLAPVRMLFAPNVLKNWGREWKDEQPAFSDPKTWPKLMEKSMNLVTPVPLVASPVVHSGPSVGAESLMDDEYEVEDDD